MAWWTASAQRTLTERVPAAPDVVRGFYVDPDNIKLVHPLVVSVRGLARSRVSDGYVQAFRVSDRIPLRFFTLRTSYQARLYVPDAGDVIAEARQFPNVRLHSTVTFEPIEGGTRVIERMRVDAPRLLAGVTVREAVKSHIAMWAGIRCRFE